ncbi:MAG: hypothetical protein ACFB0Z_04540 [Candidatus Phaeomarinobacter sp.]
MLQGWGTLAHDPRLPVFSTRTPAFNRLAQRAAATTLTPPDTQASLASALDAVARGDTPVAPSSVLDGVLRAQGGLSQHPEFQSFVRDLTRVGGDCHLLCCLTSSGIEGYTAHAAKIAATLSHEGIRVWVHAVLDGRDTAPDAALGAMHEFLEDVGGVDTVRFATVSGRAYALDETADTKALALMRDAVVDAMPQQRGGLGEHIDAQNQAGINDGDIKPAAAPTYPGMRSDDALLVLHPQADGFSDLLNVLLPDDTLDVPSARPATLSACRRMIGWPKAGSTPAAQARQPLSLFQPSHPRLADVIRASDMTVLMTAPRNQHAIWAATMEGCTVSASKTLAASHALEAADAAVRAIKQGETDIILTLLGGIPASARSLMGGSLGASARRTIEQQDKGLGRIAAIIERRGGTLMALGTDTSLTPAEALPCLIHGGPCVKETPMRPGTLADIAPTILALAGTQPSSQFSGTSLLEGTEVIDAEAS